VTDIVRVKDEYYVRATSALADDRTRVLNNGDTFAVLIATATSNRSRLGPIRSVPTPKHAIFPA